MDSVTNEKLYMTLGNHDITSYPREGYHQNIAAEARATWIKNVPCFSKGTYYSRLYDVGSTTYRFIFEGTDLKKLLIESVVSQK